jgi:hypothetical protein
MARCHYDRFLKDQTMSIRFLASLAASLSIFFSGTLLAREQGNILEMKHLQALISVINSELKADLDQILMLEQAIKVNAQTPLQAQGRSPDPVLYDDVAAGQRRAIQRENAMNARLDALLARSVTLDARKQTLLERLQELGLLPQEPAVKPGKTQK